MASACGKVMRTLNLTLLTDLYEITMMQGYFETGKQDMVVFDAFTAKTRAMADMPLPPGWNRSLSISKPFSSPRMISGI